jgi:hypothetical protein
MSKPKHKAFPPTFLLLQQEGYLISSCLSTGLTALRAANVHNKGEFYTALFNLSVGFERLLKAIVIIDHMLNNKLKAPTKKQLQVYGHDIAELYDTCDAIGNKRQSEIPARSQLDPIDQELLLLISDFAQVTRYHNLDALSASQAGLDPLNRWGQLILDILRTDVPKKLQEKILNQAHLVAAQIDNNTLTLMHGLDQSPLTTAEALSLPGLHGQGVRFAVLRLVNMLSPVRDLLGHISEEAYPLNLPVPPFPQMQEFLEWLWNDRQFVLRKKRWP